MEAGSPRRVRRSDRLLALLSGYEQLVVVTHDTPDPDSIASGWVVWLLIQQCLGRTARFVGRGAILRAENRHMMELLRPPLEMVHDLELSPQVGTVLVDCHPQSSNHPLDEKHPAPIAVIDHHASPGRHRRLPFEDIRCRALASGSIVTSYLREQQVEPGAALATALLYGIRTESRSAETPYSPLDRSATLWLSKRADFSMLSEIEDAPLEPAYFGDLVLALQSTLIYGQTGFCLLPRANNPEIVGEVADLLIRCQEIRRVLCGAVSGENLCISVRTVDPRESATELVRTTLAGMGHGGGHQHRAGGRIPGVATNPYRLKRLHAELRARWLAACGAEDQPPRRLIAKHEIVRNL